MAEVDWVLERLAIELHRVHGELDIAHGRIAELEAAERAGGGSAERRSPAVPDER